MAPPERRAVADNLDPLVDTLSNVVGILVIVVALTQIQLGEALTRVLEVDRMRGAQELELAAMPSEAQRQAARRDVLMRRTEADLDEATRLGRETLLALAELNDVPSADEPGPLEDLEARLKTSEAKLNESLRIRDQRARHRAQIQKVPKRMVARLPDPQVFEGKTSWILVRHGRVYLLDRDELLRKGTRAIGLILDNAQDRRIRIEELETVAHYLRKISIGDQNLVWRLKTEPNVRARLEWRSEFGGLAHTELDRSSAMRLWLSKRSADVDVIRFHVWADSFEAYLAAREVVEQAGFRAGWFGHEIDQDFDLNLRFGPPEPETRPLQVD